MSLFSNWLNSKAVEELAKRDKRVQAQLEDVKHKIVSKEIINHLLIALGCIVLVLCFRACGYYG